jgi:chloride channel protein, CIC family
MKKSFLTLLPDGLNRLDERLLMILIAAVVGGFCGVASVLLNLGLKHGSDLLKMLGGPGYQILFPACGMVLALLFLRIVMRDAGGHGVPEVIHSVSSRGGYLRLRTSVSRLGSCLLTIASGGSAGPEAPVVTSGASIGSNNARLFRLRARQRIVLVGCGAASAIAAIFNAPVTGIAFALEVILGEWTPVHLVPISISAVVGTMVSRALQGNQIPFAHRAIHRSLTDLAACVGLALLTAVAAVLFVRLMRLTGALLKTTMTSIWLRAAVAGALVGGIGWLVPEVLGDGYEHVGAIIDGTYGPGLFLIGIVVLAKALATALTIGGGGIGGVFAPSLVIGSYTGLFYQRVLVRVFPGISWAGESYFGLLGMAGVISSALQAPMTGTFLIMEITGGYDVLVSVLLVSVLSATISHFMEPYSIYLRGLIAQGVPIRARTDARVLSELKVMELLETDCYLVRPDMLLRDFVPVAERSHRNYFPVVDGAEGRFLGMIHRDEISPFLLDPTFQDTLVLEEVMNRNIVTVSPDEDLQTVLKRFDETRSWSLPVVEDGKFLGLISKATLLDHYRRELVAQEAD